MIRSSWLTSWAGTRVTLPSSNSSSASGILRPARKSTSRSTTWVPTSSPLQIRATSNSVWSTIPRRSPRERTTSREDPCLTWCLRARGGARARRGSPLPPRDPPRRGGTSSAGREEAVPRADSGHALRLRLRDSRAARLGSRVGPEGDAHRHHAYARAGNLRTSSQGGPYTRVLTGLVPEPGLAGRETVAKQDAKLERRIEWFG